jgi:glycosyltransferase involved in cell wall biosynthesis
MSIRLSIVIPYFKKRFFPEALGSLTRQTSREFEIFVGDDASPDAPAEILRQSAGDLAVKYKRFPDNLGRSSLARQWNRCVQETDSEWVWLFSDDDLADPSCVASFLRELDHEPKYDLYRFEKGVVDDDGVERFHRVEVPAVESAEELALSRFSESRSITVPEHIFSRKAFDREGGFVDFPLAWCTDDATWAAFARITGVRTIGGGRVLWRNGQFNLSAPDQNIALKMKAFQLYLMWLQKNFPGAEFQSRLRNASREWFPLAFSWLGKSVPLRELLRFWLAYNQFAGRREWRMLMRMLRANSPASYRWRRIKRGAGCCFNRVA